MSSRRVLFLKVSHYLPEFKRVFRRSFDDKKVPTLLGILYLDIAKKKINTPAIPHPEEHVATHDMRIIRMQFSIARDSIWI